MLTAELWKRCVTAELWVWCSFYPLINLNRASIQCRYTVCHVERESARKDKREREGEREREIRERQMEKREERQREERRERGE